MKPGSVVQLDWHRTEEGSNIFQAVLQPNVPYKRKQFGLLEKPNLPSTVEEVGFKLFAYGKSGVGKTSTIARLAGMDQRAPYDSTGINVTVVYWPTKLISTSKVLLFRLEFWDVAEVSLNKFDHILPSCKEEVDATVFLFSFADRTSFEDLPKQMTKVLPSDKSCCPVVIGTKYDLHTITDVTSKDIREFEQQRNIPIIKIRNMLPESQSRAMQEAEFSEIALALNIICERLWSHDKSRPVQTPT